MIRCFTRSRRAAVLAAAGLLAAVMRLGAKPMTILPLGDSITGGGGEFSSYRMPLWELLFGHGYVVEFVGTRSSDERIGALKHEGHDGWTAEHLARHIGEIYRTNPADVVLLHAGHNHDAAERPVKGIVAAIARIVATVRELNADAIILVAQPISSGYLPRYGYLPELNQALAEFARRDALAHAGGCIRPVVLVDQTSGFDGRSDTIADRVHPNAEGARRIAARWYVALQTVLPPPVRPIPEPDRRVYKRIPGLDLTLHVFHPSGPRLRPVPAVVYFFGGGWHLGTPIQFFRESARLAERGIVAISVDYRIGSNGAWTPFDSLADAKSALRWIRSHAGELGIDPTRIAAAGASAGGHLAAAAAFVPGFDDPADDLAISCRPDGLMLLYPVLDTGPEGYRFAALGAGAAEISPLRHVFAPVPPTMVLVGDRDQVLPVATARRFQTRIRSEGGRCELFIYPDAGHPVWLYRGGENALSRDIDAKVDGFLEGIGWLAPGTGVDAEKI